MTAATPSALPHVVEDWDRALCVVAHPDDLEFGTAAAVARWTGQGKDITYCMVTSGEAGIDAMHPNECRGVREAEQIASAAIVGVTRVEFLGFPDGVLEYGIPLRAAIARMIRKLRPEIVLTGNFRETWGGRSLNSADHIAAGRAVVDAVADAGNRWVHTEQLTGPVPGAPADALEPWAAVRQVWAAGSPQATHAADITDTFDAGVASLEAHRAYIDGLGWPHFDAREFLEGISRPAGQRLGVPFAATFEVFPMAWGE